MPPPGSAVLGTRVANPIQRRRYSSKRPIRLNWVAGEKIAPLIVLHGNR